MALVAVSLIIGHTGLPSFAEAATPRSVNRMTTKGFEWQPLELPREALGTGGRYIVPNELNFFEFSGDLKGMTGVLVAVGTFRALFDAGAGNFEEVYLLDSDRDVNKFNNEQLNLIARSKNRADYISQLFADPRVGAVISMYDSGNRSLKSVQTYLKSVLASVHRRDYPHFFSEPSGFLEVMADILVTEESYRNSFLGSDAHFNRLQDLVRKRKIYVTPANLAGGRVIDWLGNDLEARGLSVSVLDVSNSLEYIRQDQKLRTYLKNILKLPWTRDAKVLSTDYGGEITKNGFAWQYLSDHYDSYILGIAAELGDATYERTSKILDLKSKVNFCDAVWN